MTHDTRPDALDYLAQLRECSLVVAEEAGEETRFRMLETLREYGAEQLEAVGETAVLRRQHAEFYLAVAERVEQELEGAHRAVWVDRLEAEHDNLRAALAWCREERDRDSAGPGGEVGQHLARALARIFSFYLHGLPELQELPRAVPLFTEFAELGTIGRAARTGEASAEERPVRLADEPMIVQIAHSIIAKAMQVGARVIHVEPGEDDIAIRFQMSDGMRELMTLPKIAQSKLVSRYKLMAEMDIAEQDSPHDGRIGITHRGTDWDVLVHSRPGPYGEEVVLRIIPLSPTEESLAVWRELRDEEAVALTLARLGNLARGRGDLPPAAALLTESVARWRALGTPWGLALSLCSRGGLALEQSDHRAASADYREALVIRRDLGDAGGVAECLEGLAAAAAGSAGPREQLRRATRLFGAAEAIREGTRAACLPVRRTEDARDVTAARAALGEEEFASAWAEGQAMSQEQAVALALQEPSSGTDDG
jgi:hypothetical protein